MFALTPYSSYCPGNNLSYGTVKSFDVWLYWDDDDIAICMTST